MSDTQVVELACDRLLAALTASRQLSFVPAVPIVMARLGDTQRAVDLATRYPDARARFEACLGVGDVLLERGAVPEAVRVLRAALDAEVDVAVHDADDPFTMGEGDETSGERAAHAFARIAVPMARAGELSAVEGAVADYAGPYAATILALIISELAETGELAAARKFADALPSHLDRLPDGSGAEIAQEVDAAVARAATTGDLVPAVDEVVEQAEARAAAATDGPVRVQALADAATTLLRGGDPERALALVDQAINVAEATGGAGWLGQTLVFDAHESLNLLGRWSGDDGAWAAALARAIAQSGSLARVSTALAGLEAPVLAVRGRWLFARLLAEAGRTADAVAVARELEGPAELIHALGLISAEGDPHAAELAQAARATVLPALSDPHVGGLTTLVETLARAGELESAEEVASAIEGLHERLDALTIVAQECERAGRAERAAALVERVLREGEMVPFASSAGWAIAHLAGCLAGGAAPEGARAAVEAAEALARRSEDELMRDSALVEVATAFATAGLLDEGLRVARTVGGAGGGEVHEAVLAHAARTGDLLDGLGEARGTLDPDRANETLARAVAFARLAEPLVRAGRTEDGLMAAVEASLLYEVCPPGPAHDAAVADVVHAAAAAGVPSPLRLLDGVEDVRNVTAGALEAARAFLRLGAASTAVDIAGRVLEHGRRMVPSTPQVVRSGDWMRAQSDTQLARVTAFAGAAGVAFAAGDLTRGREAMTAALEELDSVPPGAARIAALAEAAAALRPDDPVKAGELAAEAANAMARLDASTDAPDHMALEHVLETLVAVDDTDAAELAWRRALLQWTGAGEVVAVVAAGAAVLRGAGGVNAVERIATALQPVSLA